jgi:outer membrane receptor protein involved in Fe transport
MTGFAAAGHAQQASLARLREMSLEELGAIEITSVSKRAEPLSDAAASVFVITADDIRRAGATTLPEALRLAPGLQVSRDSATGYVISARGFNATNSNKLLVLIDGRSVYTPLFSGVFWDVQDLVLEDVERIEVISGPGGTLWGVNAVNGIINVITQRAAQTQGTMMSVGAGQRESMASARYGGALGEQGHFRIDVRHLDRRPSHMPDGSARDDAARQAQTASAHSVRSTTAASASRSPARSSPARRWRWKRSRCPARTCSRAGSVRWRAAPASACRPISTARGASSRRRSARSSTSSACSSSTGCGRWDGMRWSGAPSCARTATASTTAA